MARKNGSDVAPSPRLELAVKLRSAGALVSDAEKEEVRRDARARGLSVPMREFLKPRYPPKK